MRSWQNCAKVMASNGGPFFEPQEVELHCGHGPLLVTCRSQGTHPTPSWRLQVLYIAHVGDSGAVMACKAYDLHFPLRLTTDHKPNRPDEHARIQGAGGSIDERHNRVISEPKPHNGRVTLLSMSRCGTACLPSLKPCPPRTLLSTLEHIAKKHRGVNGRMTIYKSLQNRFSACIYNWVETLLSSCIMLELLGLLTFLCGGSVAGPDEVRSCCLPWRALAGSTCRCK